jgi:hypothetical protein
MRSVNRWRTGPVWSRADRTRSVPTEGRIGSASGLGDVPRTRPETLWPLGNVKLKSRIIEKAPADPTSVVSTWKAAVIGDGKLPTKESSVQEPESVNAPEKTSQPTALPRTPGLTLTVGTAPDASTAAAVLERVGGPTTLDPDAPVPDAVAGKGFEPEVMLRTLQSLLTGTNHQATPPPPSHDRTDHPHRRHGQFSGHPRGNLRRLCATDSGALGRTAVGERTTTAGASRACRLGRPLVALGHRGTLPA